MAPVPRIMVLKYPLIQEYKTGAWCHQSTRYSDHLAVTCAVNSSHLYLVPAQSFDSQFAALPLSMIQVHLDNEPRLSNLFTSSALVHQGHNTSRLLLSFSQLRLWRTLNLPTASPQIFKDFSPPWSSCAAPMKTNIGHEGLPPITARCPSPTMITG